MTVIGHYIFGWIEISETITPFEVSDIFTPETVRFVCLKH